jgi:hypothetical protein
MIKTCLTAGITNSTDFPVQGTAPTGTPFQASYGGGDNDAFVARLDSTGHLTYSSYLGGGGPTDSGNGTDGANGVAFDSAGNIIVVGQTGSSDFPVVNYPPYLLPSYSIFITELSAATGYSSAVFSRYYSLRTLSLWAPNTSYSASQTIIDPNGNLEQVTTAGTSGSIQPLWSLAKGSTTNDSTVVWTNQGPQLACDTANAVATDLQGDIFVGGTKKSCDATLNDGEAFAVKLKGGAGATPGQGVFGWLLVPSQGSSDSSGQGIAVDANGEAILTGKFCRTTPCLSTLSPWTAFVLKINALGSNVLWNNSYPSTSTSTTGMSTGNAIAVDGNGFIYVAGTTTFSDFPVVSPTQTVLAGGEDAFVMKLNQSGSATIFSTFFGAADSDTGNGIAVTSDGNNIYLAGSTLSYDLPTSNALQSAYAGSGDAFLVKWAGAALPYASLNPLSINFGDQALNTTSALQAVTLTNLGDAPLEITGINSAGQFVQSHTCGATLAAGQNCTISVTFQPTATGIQTGSLTVVDSVGTQTVTLTGNGVLGTVQIVPTTLSFGSQTVGSTGDVQTVTVTNTSPQPLTMGAIGASGDFSSPTSTCGATLAPYAPNDPNDSCTISLIFQPSATGPRAGTLTITDSAANSPQTVPLAGNGVAPIVSLSALALKFSDQKVNTVGAPLTLTVSNIGNAPLIISGLTTSPSDFVIKSTTCLPTVAVNASCTILVAFAPTVSGLQTGSLTITSNDPGSPQIVALSGQTPAAPPDFAMTLTPLSASVSANNPATINLQIAPVSGFNSTVALTCSGAPSNVTCTIGQPLIKLDGKTTVSTTVNLSMTALQAGLAPAERPFASAGGLAWALIPAPFGLVFFGGMFESGASRRRRIAIGAVLILLLVGLWAGCGGSHGSGSNGGSGGSAITITGTYTDANGQSVSHSVQLTVWANYSLGG